MHRIRTWARAKAHGDSRLVTSSRGASTPRTSTGLSSASRTVPRQGDGTLATEKESTPTEGATGENEKAQPEKKPVVTRFFTVIWNVLTSSWLNVLLVFVPVGIAVRCAGMSDGMIFGMNAIAIVPLAGLLAHATESVAKRLGDTVGALMNVTFGNAVELIIFIIALVKNEIRIVQASLLGSILSNLLLILGMCFVLGGLRFREQIYNSTVTQMSACLLSLSVISLLLPTAFHASFSSTTQADLQVLKVSRGTSVILLLVYFLYLLFQLNSHAYMYESTPQHVIDRESQSYRSQPGALPPIVPIVVNSQPRTTAADGEDDEEPEISRTSAILLLLVSTALVALCAEFMVDAIDGVVAGNSGLSEAFVGLILLPIVGNAAEHVTAVTVAVKNKMDLAIGVAIGSSIQIALFVTPLVVILGWIMNKDMSLYFTLFETISMFVSAFIVNFLVLDGRSNYLEGSLLCAAYVIIALAAFFYPDSDEANSIGGGSDEASSTNTEAVKLMARGVMGMLGWH
ncbi:hypothetical protein VSDG_08674 [Cytospora chrysosperma]|uniref:Vacuolar calcium ion transporter n=1 Tax=Cytospora chrysosperma TaxID=252740 RepID=A0A423VEU0_CYTCH|nr:hypothetical protein VSDG_08674 [Valsa sordida]